MANAMQLLPEIEPDEQAYIQILIKNMSDEKAQTFANAYRARRKDSTNLLLFALIGFLGIAGIQRFMVGQTGMGLLYLLTGGLCAVGTIIDMVIAKKLAFEFNRKEAEQIAAMVKAG